nr:hypothetical protein GCM10025730_21060 [Promicromonospora thailandica]
MRDLLPRLLGWWRAGERAAVATVVHTVRSAPREPGAAMAVGPGGEVLGSVSGGCVEGAVYDVCLEVAESGRPVLARYGVAADAAFDASFDVGLTCGGTVEVFVAPLSRTAWPGFDTFVARVADGGPGVCLATVLAAPEGGRVTPGRRLVVGRAADGSGAGGTLGDPGLDAAVAADAVGQVGAGASAVREYGPRGERTGTGTQVFLQAFAPRPVCSCSAPSSSRPRWRGPDTCWATA